jgi:hypothetical protein
MEVISAGLFPGRGLGMAISCFSLTCTTVIAIEKRQETVSPVNKDFFGGLTGGYGMLIAKLLKCRDVAKPSAFLDRKIS